MGKRAKHVYVYSVGNWTEVENEPTHIYNLDGHPAYEYTSESEVINVFAPDGLVARKTITGNWIYYQFDQQGNVAQRLNSSGTVLNSSSYDAYGNEALNGSTQNDPWAYNAQWGYVKDVDTGLYYCQSRWYDPATGRWLNRDPIGYSGGANLYSYCNGGPIQYQDAIGLARKRAVIIVGAPTSEGFFHQLADETGDTLALNAYRGILGNRGYEVSVLIEPDCYDAYDAVRGTDALALIGHGKSRYYRQRGRTSGGIRLRPGPNEIDGSRDGETSIDSDVIANVRGKRKLDLIIVFACGQGAHLDSWFKSTDEVWATSGVVSALEGELDVFVKPRARKTRVMER